MHLGPQTDRHNYHMWKEENQIELQVTELEKDLGIHIDPKLTFSIHCEKKVSTANRILGMIRRSYTYLDELSLTKLYTTLVRPHLEYGNGAWSPTLK